MVEFSEHLRRPVTYLRLVFVLLGSALAVGIAILDATLIVIVGQYLHGWLLVLAGAVIVVVPFAVVTFVPPIRQVEAAAAESLLGVSFPDGAPGPATSAEERLRATAWFVLHVLIGAALVVDLAVFLPSGLAYLTAPWRAAKGESVSTFGWGEAAGGWEDAWMPLAGAAVLVAGVILPFLIAAGVSRLAPALLGPSYGQRLRALEAETAGLVERNRIARELHDSVGHALSVVSLQASAARRRLQARDPVFAEGALEAIEATARSATAELDHMLGLLREGSGRGARTPALGLSDLEALFATTRRAGLVVQADLDNDLGDVPSVIGRESYRIVQEGLTNALRHARRPTARVAVSRYPDRLVITISNPVRARASRRAGRGLTGISERVLVLGGSVDHSTQDGTWLLRVELPLPRKSKAAGSAASTTASPRQDRLRTPRTPPGRSR